MRRVALAMLLALGFGQPARAEDCTKQVLEAFQKQRASKAFSVAMQQPSAEGMINLRVDYLPPDKMLQTVTSPAMPGEQQTMLVGNRAYAGSQGAFEELLPQFTQSIISEVKNALGDPGKELGHFDCKGKATFEGKEFVTFTALDAAAPKDTPADKVLARTIYVDEATGLPMYNVVAQSGGKADPVVKASYAYPADLVIEEPKGAPMQKIR